MKQIVLLLVFFFSFQLAFSGIYTGKEASAKITGTKKLLYAEGNDFPVYICFQDQYKMSPQKISVWLSHNMQIPDNNEFKPFFEWTSPLDIQVIRFRQYYQGIEVESSNMAVQIKEGQVISMSGNAFNSIEVLNSSVLSESAALEKALLAVPAELYKWQKPGEEAALKMSSGKQDATWFPKGQRVIYPIKNESGKATFVYAWKFDVFAHKPMQRKYVWVDASTGKILNTESRIQDADVIGSAVTKYSGTQAITTDDNSGSYRLQETGRGNGIQTYNMNMTADYGSATDFIDADNVWNNVNAAQDEVATDAHFAAEKMYDYLLNTFTYHSLDNNDLQLISYVHYNLEDAGYPNNLNAFWNGSSMNYGDGTSSVSPLTTLDIAGHEMMHGVTGFSAGLVYQDESGSLNEGFSDIFGTVLEFYASPATADWTMGEDIGYIMRSLSDPNQYGKPDTYHGDHWVYDSSDNGGVHTNCGVLAYWFYLLSEGGSGTNDIGNAYSVSGLGMNAAADIAFTLVTAYLPPDATYNLTRFFAIQVAVDIYGPCTPGVEAVTNAMYAVGLGSPYVPQVVSDFSAPLTETCMVPLTVSFTNLSLNSSSFIWNFGDGFTSTDANPEHTYNTLGNYTVTLTSDGGSCGNDVNVVTDFVSIDPANPCVVYLPGSGTVATQTACFGTLYDYGGPDGNYIDNSDSYITIAPAGASNVILNFLSFDVEPGSDGNCDFDYLEVFDGPNTSSPSVGLYCNDTGTPGTITSTGGALTIHFHSDQGLSLSGFEAQWSCNLATAPPIAQFIASETESCSGTIQFNDMSTNNPQTWLWDFGDGQTSTLQNPIHMYLSDNTYDVSLYVENIYGNNELVKNSYVTIAMPSLPVALDDTVCENESASLLATVSGTPRWYDAALNGTLLYTGSPFVTQSLVSDVTYFVENAVIAQSQYVGATNVNSGGSFFTAASVHYLEFNCYSPVKLVSVQVNAQSSGNRTILLKNSSGSILASRTVNIPSGVSRINLDIDLPIANGLQLVGPASPGLYRNDSGTNYPYTIPGIISIINSSASTDPTGYYYFFYDWEVKEADCVSARIPVNVHVDTCSGIDNVVFGDISVFPVPAENVLNISNNGNLLIQKFRIIDAQGRIVMGDDYSDYPIQISGLSQGFYIIELMTIENVYPLRFVKE